MDTFLILIRASIVALKIVALYMSLNCEKADFPDNKSTLYVISKKDIVNQIWKPSLAFKMWREKKTTV
jgi:hypothetical protein